MADELERAERRFKVLEEGVQGMERFLKKRRELEIQHAEELLRLCKEEAALVVGTLDKDDSELNSHVKNFLKLTWEETQERRRYLEGAVKPESDVSQLCTSISQVRRALKERKKKLKVEDILAGIDRSLRISSDALTLHLDTLGQKSLELHRALVQREDEWMKKRGGHVADNTEQIIIKSMTMASTLDRFLENRQGDRDSEKKERKASVRYTGPNNDREGQPQPRDSRSLKEKEEELKQARRDSLKDALQVLDDGVKEREPRDSKGSATDRITARLSRHRSGSHAIQHIFGASLQDQLADPRQQPYGDSVPWILQLFKRHLLAASNPEGIFRVAASAAEILKQREHLESGGTDFLPYQEVFVIADLFKVWLRELPQPLLPETVQERALVATSDNIIKDILTRLPMVHYEVVAYICGILSALVKLEAKTRMPLDNLALVFAPTFFNKADPKRLLELQPAMSNFVSTLVTTIGDVMGEGKTLSRRGKGSSFMRASEEKKEESPGQSSTPTQPGRELNRTTSNLEQINVRCSVCHHSFPAEGRGGVRKSLMCPICGAMVEFKIDF